jgi:hypothetical protein
MGRQTADSGCFTVRGELSSRRRVAAMWNSQGINPGPIRSRSVEDQDVVTTLSHRRPDPMGSARTGPGPGSCVLTPSRSHTGLTRGTPKAARLYPTVRGAARYAGRAADWGEPREDAPPWDAA